MVAPVVVAAGITAASSLLGGLMSSNDARRQAARQEALQREFAQMGIRWRVADAKAAGLHPLYALGGQVSQYQPVYTGDQSMGPALSEAGQNVARAVAAQQTPVEAMMTNLGLQKMQSEIAETDARRDYYLSEAERNRQAANAAQTFPVSDPFQELSAIEGNYARSQGAVVPEAYQNWMPYAGQVQVPPGVSPSTRVGDPSTVAGNPALWREFEISPGRRIALPGGMQGDASEALETLSESPLMMWMVYRENARRFGDEWASWFFRRYIFDAPVPPGATGKPYSATPRRVPTR